MTARRRPRRATSRRAFSMIETLLALTISAMLLTASLAALDASYKQYTSTTESASTHVVSRIVMHRLLAMVRTGVEFGPFPADVYDPAQNPVVSDFIEFRAERDIAAGVNRVTRVELRPGPNPGDPGELWYVLVDTDPMNPAILEERPLIRGVVQAAFILNYNRDSYLLDKATIDLTIAPNDSQDLRLGALGDPSTPQTIRLVASAAPRQGL
ncbi:MAG: prepilin-type N-terminal cleavage/methylation domain-containing protein [Planctomycetota bacterium]|nr:MAG: prepilin-type N-terminal cleavage/methylation domain-containing protein [Planctomycetota bacterium]